MSRESTNAPAVVAAPAPPRRGVSCGGVLLVAMLGAFAAVALGIGAKWFETFESTPAIGEAVSFEVQPGEGAASVLQRLIADDVVDEVPWWPLYLRLYKPGHCLVAGAHELPANATPSELFDALCAPTFEPTIRVTIPEGTNVYQLADRLSEAGFGSRDDYLALWDDAEFLAELGVAAPTLEGYLAPDTYELYRDASARDVLVKLARHGASVRASLWDTLVAPADAFSELQILTVASIVEEEAQVASERPIIARVIYNRLAAGMQIQCDPTCVYGPDTYNDVPTRAVCRDPASTHSTYVLPGLPPTPISNPGRASIAAALRPAEDAGVLYFVAMQDGSGRHVFSSTLAEHNRNVDRYLRGR